MRDLHLSVASRDLKATGDMSTLATTTGHACFKGSGAECARAWFQLCRTLGTAASRSPLAGGEPGQ